MALAKQTAHVPLGRGLNTESDPRALEIPALAVCRNAEFDESGGLQTRKPFSNISVNILGGGTLSDIRKMLAFGDELLCFTKEALYSWSASDSAWVSKGTHLAAKVSEKSVFTRTSRQVDCDRAELNGVVVYAWADDPGIGIYVAAVDKETGAVLLAPYAVDSGASLGRPVLVTLSSVIHLYYESSSSLKGQVITPTALATSVATTPTTVGSNFNACFDATVAANVVYLAYRRSVTTSYEVKKITAALSVTASTKARTCDGPIAVSVAPTGTHLQIVRANSTNIQGDLLLTSDLSDVYTAQAVGTVASTPVFQIAAAHRSVQNSSQYRCYAFWSYDEDQNSATWEAKYNWVDDGNNLGTQARLAYRLGIASRAFDHNGSVFVWTVFAGASTFSGGALEGFRSQLQNTYFLYRDDEFLVAKATATRSGGISAAIGHLPNVQSLGGGVYAWCGVERRIIPVGSNQTDYAAQGPRDIHVAFDSDDARRCARLGETVYVVGGEVLQYDGVGLYETNFHIYPWAFGAIELVSSGSVANGTYGIKCTLRWDNAKGERDRSTTATVGDITVSAGPNSIQIATLTPVQVTHKTGTTNKPVVEVWRTLVSPQPDSPFYLVTSQTPGTTGDNRQIDNDYDSSNLGTWEDALADASIATLENCPENGGVLESLCPPGASIICASQERLFIAGIPGEPHRVAYSKLRGLGEVAAFHDALTVELPPEGGPITALGFLDETLVAFKETAVYALPGDGFDNAGGGQNYGPSRRMAADVGAVSAEAIGVTPAGLMFKSRKGWYMLLRNGAVEYIGGPVAEFDDDEVRSVHVVEAQHQVRILTDARALVFDYKAGQWAEWTITNARGACVWQGTYVYCTTTEVKAERETFENLSYGLDVETPWIPLAGPGGLQGFGGIWGLQLLGEFRSACDLRWRVAYDYEESDASGPAWVDDKFQAITQTTVGGPIQLKHGPRRARCQAIKVRLTTYAAGSTTTPPSGEGIKLTSLALSFGVEPQSLYRRMPATAKQ